MAYKSIKKGKRKGGKKYNRTYKQNGGNKTITLLVMMLIAFGFISMVSGEYYDNKIHDDVKKQSNTIIQKLLLDNKHQYPLLEIAKNENRGDIFTSDDVKSLTRSIGKNNFKINSIEELLAIIGDSKKLYIPISEFKIMFPKTKINPIIRGGPGGPPSSDSDKSSLELNGVANIQNFYNYFRGDTAQISIGYQDLDFSLLNVDSAKPSEPHYCINVNAVLTELPEIIRMLKTQNIVGNIEILQDLEKLTKYLGIPSGNVKKNDFTGMSANTWEMKSEYMGDEV